MIYRTGLYSYEAQCILRLAFTLKERYQVECQEVGTKKLIVFNSEPIEPDSFPFRKEFFPSSVVQDFNGEIIIGLDFFSSSDDPKKRMEELFSDGFENILIAALDKSGLASSSLLVPVDKYTLEDVYPGRKTVPISVDMIHELKRALLDNEATSMRGVPFDVFKSEQIKIIVEELLKDCRSLSYLSNDLSRPDFRCKDIKKARKKLDSLKPRIIEYKTKLHSIGYPYSVEYIKELDAIKDEKF